MSREMTIPSPQVFRTRGWCSVFVPLAAVVLGMLWWGTAARAETPAAEMLFPKVTMAFASFPNLTQLKERMLTTNLGRLWTDPALAEFVKSAEEGVKKWLDNDDPDFGLSLQSALSIPVGEVAIGVLSNGTNRPNVVVVVDVGSHREDLDKLLEKIELAMERGKSEKKTAEVQGETITSFKQGSQQVSYCIKEQALIVSSTVSGIETVLSNWSGGRDVLGESENFQLVRHKCESGEAAIFQYYLDPLALAKMGLKSNPLQMAIVMATLPSTGFDKIKAIGGRLEVGADAFDSIFKSFIVANTPAAGLVKVFDLEVRAAKPPTWISDEACEYLVSHNNLSAAYDAIAKFYDSQMGPGSFGKWVKRNSQNELGIHIKNDVVDHLSGTWHLVGKANEEHSAMVFALELKDEVKAKAVLDRLFDKLKAAVEEHQFEGVAMQEINLGNLVIFSAVSQQHLLVSGSKELLESVLRKGETRTPLPEAPWYRRLISSLPAQACFYWFEDSATTWKPAFAALRKSGLPVDFEKLPGNDVLTKFLAPTATYILPDDQGALVVWFQLKAE